LILGYRYPLEAIADALTVSRALNLRSGGLVFCDWHLRSVAERGRNAFYHGTSRTSWMARRAATHEHS
jgi:hypothetical protein